MFKFLTLFIITFISCITQLWCEPFTEYDVLQKQFDSRNKYPAGKKTLLAEKKLFDKIFDTLKPTDRLVFEYNSSHKLLKQSIYRYDTKTSNEYVTGFYSYYYDTSDSLKYIDWSYPDSNQFKTIIDRDYTYYYRDNESSKVINYYEYDGSLNRTDSLLFIQGKLSFLNIKSIEANNPYLEEKYEYQNSIEKKTLTATYSYRFFNSGEWHDWYIDDKFACTLDDSGNYLFRTLIDANMNNKKYFIYDNTGLLVGTIDTNISLTPNNNYITELVKSKFYYKFDDFGRITEQTWDKKSNDPESVGSIKVVEYIYSEVTDVNPQDVQKSKIIDLNLSGNSNSIMYKLFESGTIAITLYNFLGQELGIIDSGYKEAGDYVITIDNPSIVSGMYFFVLKLNNKYYCNKIIKVQ